MSELLNATVNRLEVMRADTELLVHAFAGAVVLAAAEDARASAAINYDDKTTLDTQRKTEDAKVALQLAWREAQYLSNAVTERLDVFRDLEVRLAKNG
ncbi:MULTISPECIES: hypothetical protein [unclassified Rhizobium]|uniref:hypothetical protein n=1 Tax=unclassified Rhizobium TaxID=2613769 RepID=UPI00161FF4FE|nr:MULTISPECIES: hypothetical protein [unclassified Rhizobium]MBB3318841.1 hypothetical protein [Rhizobium sp. BK181]MCS3742389.1 hypothetical protein [Rhizobium sp. BK661]MCS4094783.1 hypothetical protein [Rhizobium sp. BK176]